MGHEVSSVKEPYGFMEQASRLIFDYVMVWLKKTNDDVSFTPDDVSVYWFSKDNEDWRVLLTTSLRDDVYYQVTHSSKLEETSIEVFHKYGTVTIPDKDFA